MLQTDSAYSLCMEILRQELVPAMGCTEPIAVAYAAAVCRRALNQTPVRCALIVSGPIIKNVKSVIVPHTGGRKGLEVAVAAGVVGGDADAKLEVLSGIRDDQQNDITAFLHTVPTSIIPADNDEPFYIDLTLCSEESEARVIIQGQHTNITHISRNGAVLFEKEPDASDEVSLAQNLRVSMIWEFINAINPEDISSMLSRMIDCNSRISWEGLHGSWGAQIGKMLYEQDPQSVHNRARAAAAAGSDARMSGCEMPVVIVSGSGNQGMTASLPVLEYAKALGSSREQLLRALALSALITVHIKTGIGRVSAFCGAVCAGIGAGCGIAYLHGAGLDAVEHTITNALGIASGMICDGAKPSCAAKIAVAVDAGITGYQMYCRGQQFCSGDGIIRHGVEETILAIGELASCGMRQTDRKILEIMVRK